MTAERWDVVGVGENSVDSVYVVDALPGPGAPTSKAEISERRLLLGGQMATALATCASLGLRVTYAGATGADANGRLLRGELERRGIDTAHLVERAADTRTAVIFVERATGDRVIAWHRDPALNLRDAELPLDAIKRARAVHVDQSDMAAALRAARAGRAAGALVTTDVDDAGEGTGELIGLATHAILAGEASRKMTGVADPEAALRRLRTSCDAVLIATLGPEGASALEGDRFVHVPAFRVAASDTTGAGDVFRGAFLTALLESRQIEAALRFANAAAAVSCTRTGALNGVPARAEIEQLLG